MLRAAAVSPAVIVDDAAPVAVSTPVESDVVVALVATRFVVNLLVEVEFVEVLLILVKFWSVDDPVARMFDAVTVPLVVMFPPVAEVNERFVVDALVANKFVLVALVVVERVMLLKMFAPENVPLSA